MFHTDLTAKKIPGLRWIIFGHYLSFAITLRLVLFHYHIPMPARMVSQLGNLLIFLVISYGFFVYVRSAIPKKLSIPILRIWIILWIAIVTIQFLFGILWSNYWGNCGREAIIMYYFCFFLIFGLDDRVWSILQKHLTILFYMAVPIIIIYYQTPGLCVDIGDNVNIGNEVASSRFTDSLGYQFRVLIKPAVFLSMFGLVTYEKSILKTMQITTLPMYFFIEVGLFSFRSIAVISICIISSFIFLRPFYEKRIRPWMSFAMIVVMISSISYYMTTESYTRLHERMFVQTQKSSILDSRINEFKEFLKSSTCYSILIGKGLGGVFDASKVFRIEGSKQWKSMHFGIFIFLLKGGIGMFVLFLILILKCIKLRAGPWYRNPCNLTAALLLPIYLANFIFNPFDLRPESLFVYGPMMMVLSRFYRRQILDNQRKMPRKLFLRPNNSFDRVEMNRVTAY